MTIQEITVEVKISSIWIYPFYTIKEAKKLKINPTSTRLENTFTDWENVPGNPGIKFPKFNFLFIYDEEKHIFKVPIGFGLDKLLNILHRELDGIPIKVKHNVQPYPVRKVNTKLKENVKIKNDIQKGAIGFLLREKNSGKFLTLATGFGKTFCVIYTAAKKKVPFLIITSKLVKQWISQIKKFLDISDDEIYEIRGRNSIQKLIKEKNPKHIFYVSSTSSLYQRMKLDVNLDDVFKNLGIGVKVFDEAHEFYKTNCEIDCNSNFAETFYLTATPMRSDTRENVRYSKMFSEIPKHGEETHYMNKNYIIYLINYHSHPSSYELKKAMSWKRNMLNAHVHAAQIMGNDRKRILFFGMISQYIRKVQKVIDGKILVVLTSLNQIKQLKEFLETYHSDVKIARYDSTVKFLDREVSKQADIILTTFGIAYAGLDIQNLAAVFSLSPFQSPIGTSQLLGRLARNTRDVFFLDFLDEGYPRMYIQRKNRLRELEPRAKKIYRNTISEVDIIKYLRSLEEE